MLDEFETGMSKGWIEEIFLEIQTALVPLIVKVLASSHAPSTEPLKGKFPIEKQKEISERIVTATGWDKELGRLDVSVHPFTSLFSPSDVRITSSSSEDEGGHGKT